MIDRVSAVSNAIGFEIFGHDRPTTEVDGVEQIEVTAAEAIRCHRAAVKAVEVYLETGPKIVAIVGSTLYRDAHLEAARIEEMHGKVPLLSVAWVKSSAFDEVDERLTERLREQLDKVVNDRIDLASEVLVVNIAGYIGESTAGHIRYAEESGKKVRYYLDELE